MAKKLCKLSGALLEMAGGQYRSGLMDRASHEKIIVRLLGPKSFPTVTPISARENREIREAADLSQAVFSHSLNLSVG
jgi:putative transcriptional regulator